MYLLRLYAYIIVLLSLFPFIHAEKAYPDHDSFYEGFLLQRMMIAKIREIRGDASAKTLMKSLARKAKKSGMNLPGWSLDSSEGIFKYDLPVRKEIDMERYDPLIHTASRINRLHPALIKGVIHAESSFKKDSVSSKGEMGLMQLMPEISRNLKINNPFDPQANILGGSYLLGKYLNKYGSVKRALIAYNAGEGWIMKDYHDIPKETKTYIRRVINFYHKYKKGYNHDNAN